MITPLVALQAWRARADVLWRTLLRPPPRMSLSDYADRYRVLTRESSAEPGRWRTDRTPYLRGIQDTFSDRDVRQICWVAASQVGKTELVNNCISYVIDLDPGPILVVNYSEKMAESWSKDRFAPMIRAMPRLADKVGDPRSRDSGNTILHKTFPGGHITAVGSNSPANLSSRPIRYLFLDEIDRYEASAGTEGDPVRKATQRTRTFVWSKKVIEISSPTIDKVDDEDDILSARASRIQKSWVHSDQRFYYVPCPHCSHMQVLFKPSDELRERIIWETDTVDGQRVHRPETAAYRCQNCACLIEERYKLGMLLAGEWRATNPNGAYPGFHLSGLYSVWMTWVDIATEFLQVKNDGQLLMQFVNEVLADWWKEKPSGLKPSALGKRAESWPEDVEVPNGVGILTAGVDVQDDRLEVIVKGWGADEESWLIGHHRIYSDPLLDETWARLEHFLTREYLHEGGVGMRVRATCIDTGHLKDVVYKFVKPRQGRGVHAVKGVESRSTEPLKRAQRKTRDGIFLWTLGTYEFKDIVFRRLEIEEPGLPGYMHFCPPTDTGADGEYFRQFSAELRLFKKSSGRLVRWYKQVRKRNEAIDLEVYALAALYTMGAPVRENLAGLADALRDGHPLQLQPRRGRRVRHHGVKA